MHVCCRRAHSSYYCIVVPHRVGLLGHDHEKDRLIPHKTGTTGSSSGEIDDTRLSVAPPATPVSHRLKSILRPSLASTQTCFVRIAVWYSSSSRNKTDSISNEMKMRAYINPESSDALRGQSGRLTKLICVYLYIYRAKACVKNQSCSFAITLSYRGQATQSLTNVLGQGQWMGATPMNMFEINAKMCVLMQVNVLQKSDALQMP